MESTPPTKPAVSAASGESVAAPQLEGKLGTGGLLLTVLAFNAPIGIMAGLMPVVIVIGLGPATPFVYLGTMVLMLLFAAGLVAMARHMSQPGAFYSYITHAMGRTAGLGAGFAALATYVILAAGTYVFMGIVMNTISTGLLHGPDLPWWAWTLLAWSVVSALSLFNIDISTKVLGVLLVIEVAIVLVWDLRVFVDGGPQGRGLDLAAGAGNGSWGLALLFAIACMTGFESVQVFRSETRDPDRTVPRATYLVIIILAGFYALNSWAYLTGFGVEGTLEASAAPAESFFGSLQQYVGTVARDAANVLVVTSLFAAILAIQNIAARYTFTLARDGVLPSPLAQVHPRRHAPARAAAVLAGVVTAVDLVLAIVRVNEATWYVALQGLGLWGLIALMAWTAVSIIVFFRKNKNLESSVFKTIIAPAIATVGFVVVLFLATKNTDLLMGGDGTVGRWCIAAICVIALGGMAYARWLRSAKPEAWTRIGAPEDIH
ncbi:amino acid transporter [Amycolatopsis deserti]|uniref:Amino acid transporter n=1 Tax=Amycolatopsis deserti TaxID=185696 RepID=A0ABQ3IQR1_9PSEU|nr:APC family permease [Amycolatopsis deserti]GHE88865.1 amino acid transporter [Amycolatopsis deserti]